MKTAYKRVSGLPASLGTLMAAGILVAAGDATATNYWTSAQACVPNLGGDYATTATGTTGITNTNPTASRAYTCPIGGYPSDTMDIAYAAVYYYDAGAGVVSCALNACTNSSCSSSSTQGSLNGHNYLFWADPLGISAVTGQSWSFSCMLPPSIGSLIKSVGITI